MSDLPKGWESTSLAEVLGAGLVTDGDWVESKDQDPHGEVRLLQLADIGEGQFRDRSNRHLTSASAGDLGCTLLEVGDVLVARMPDPLGRACRVPKLDCPAVTVVDVCILRPTPTGVDPMWLMWAINTPRIRSQVAALQSGTTRKRISRMNLGTVHLAVPPLPEQKRIVAAIEEHLSRLGDATRALTSARARLRMFRDSTTAAALDGDWPVVRLGDHTVDQRYGSSAKASRAGDVPVLRMGNIIDGCLDFTDLKYLPGGHPDVESCALAPGDLLFNRTNSPELVGKSAVFEGHAGPVTFASYLIRLRLATDLEPKWVATVINSPAGRRYIDAVRTQQVGQANVNGTKLKGFPMPMPPISVQRARLSQLDASRTWFGAVEAEIVRALSRATALQRSILSGASSGQLVPQDPGDEPASVLLDRIRSERVTATSTKRPRRAKAS